MRITNIFGSFVSIGFVSAATMDNYEYNCSYAKHADIPE